MQVEKSQSFLKMFCIFSKERSILYIVISTEAWQLICGM